MISEEFAKQVVQEMQDKFGEQQTDRIETGVNQVRMLWKEKDGSKEDFRDFCLEYFIADEENLEKTFTRFEHTFEQVNGIFTELSRELSWHIDVNTGPMLPVDNLIANLSPASHLEEDLYASKIAFAVLLNFDRPTLEEMLEQGPDWTRRQWAEARLAQNFEERVPAEVSRKIHEAYVKGDSYINSYNIYMGNLLDEKGETLFPKDLKLISHWGLRDELKSQYKESDGLPRQKMIYEVMQRIITQEIPEDVINNPDVRWAVYSNEVTGKDADNSPEPNTRYATFLNAFHAQQAADPYYPTYENYIDRSFEKYREIPEETVRELFVTLLSSEEFKQTGNLVRKRLGRDLQPFDIWYTGFRTGMDYPEEKLNAIVSEKYATVGNFEKDIPNILVDLGFSYDTAQFLSSKIEVDPARGAGHAMGAGRRSDEAHLRTRVPETGMNYKGYNIAIHELGHNVEQVFSLNRIDHTLLEGVPNTAFTEAFAFVFQARDLELLGLDPDNPEAEQMMALNQLWSVCEIAGVSLVDMGAWNWMYENPDATPEELKRATISIARDIWNTYFAPVFGVKDSPILAVYSHMIDYPLYLPNYPIGHIIQFQIENYIEGKNLAEEMERMCTLGSITPDYWMQQAVGNSISVEPLLKSAEKALKEIS
ncbi:MAG: hypothetical protein K9N46_06650 [Candidatus Marinimicrobia bacterium]|nr:hypothetical protein [Candidatus Neomarinimicrobiota bacterium]MCF7828659.1 hypothetical protein [Candidatus Neomarinimicrobiota bacterium]MCF7880400.1 hypothetical protein [Candidatus Neomarinimicrobiota bacterium]